jgi:hypothetical protein
VGIHLLSLARAQKVDLAGIALSALLDQLGLDPTVVSPGAIWGSVGV